MTAFLYLLIKAQKAVLRVRERLNKGLGHG
jgi:hypothetical protein